MAFRDQIGLAQRVKGLSGAGLNGLRELRVTLDLAATPPRAIVDVSFWNTSEIAAILADTSPWNQIFPISGGNRLRGGWSSGMVQVTSVTATADPSTLRLEITPIGDYSTYTLSIVHPNIDPIFSSLAFKFRPGCFSIDCAPDWTPSPPPDPTPQFDTLARDYESFRHALIVAMGKRVPGWAATSDADLSVTLLDLFAASADELADLQDRVMNEAYLATARRRVSLARHARLVDYYIYEGNQASTILALRTSQDTDLAIGFAVSTDSDAALGATFVTVEQTPMRASLGAVRLYTWSDAIPALAKGDTSADLAFATIAEADHYVDQINKQLADQLSPPDDGIRRAPPRLLIQQQKDPESGNPAGADPKQRQLLRLTGAARFDDPQVTSAGVVRVTWEPDDALTSDYCFVELASPDHPRIEDVTLFHGNLVLATSGTAVPRTTLQPVFTRWGAVCALPPDLPLLYVATARDGATPTQSTLDVYVDNVRWDETISLVQSERDDHSFAVETDEQLRSVIRFGNSVNGQALPDTAVVKATWRAGLGLDGNVGRDRLTYVRTSGSAVTDVWNPFDAADGAAPEPPQEIRRNAPEAYRKHQLRAVTLADYVARAEEVPKVQRAAATYMWTGSWRTVRVTIDPLGGEVLTPELAADVAAHLEPLRLIGEDLEIRPPVYVPLRIELTVCLRDDVWAQDVRYTILEELSDGYTPDGQLALFNPDNWTFGQALYESEIAGRLQRISGVEHIAHLKISRWDAASPGDGRFVEVGPSEIISVRNDPDHMEKGFIELTLAGGRS